MTCTSFKGPGRTAFWAALAMPLFVVASAFLMLAPTRAQAGPELLVDAASGRVLHEKQASDPWYPASVTKLMTTYLVLRQVQAGRLSLDTPLKVSANAAKTPPSKMGFKPGTVLTVDNALKMMLVKSANDLAVVLAEGVAGSADAFAAAMNHEARRLGMSDSYFVNPHGLMDPRQRTTARDMAILARALLGEFPQFGPYFGIGGVQLGKKVFHNTNGLIGRYPGAEGLKTGFICASGFNVVASARRGNRRLIVVLLGEQNASRRTIRAAELFDIGFSGRGAAFRSVEDLPTGSRAAPPNMRETICGRNRQNLADDDNLPVQAGFADDGRGLATFWRRTTVVEGEKPGTLIRRADVAPIPVFVGPARGAAAAVTPAATDAAGAGSAVPATVPAALPATVAMPLPVPRALLPQPAAVAQPAESPLPQPAAPSPPAPAVPESAQAFAAPEPAEAAIAGDAPVALQGAILSAKPNPQAARKRTAGKPLPPPRP